MIGIIESIGIRDAEIGVIESIGMREREREREHRRG